MTVYRYVLIHSEYPDGDRDTTKYAHLTDILDLVEKVPLDHLPSTVADVLRKLVETEDVVCWLKVYNIATQIAGIPGEHFALHDNGQGYEAVSKQLVP